MPALSAFPKCPAARQVLLNPRSATAAKFDAATNLCYLARPRQGSMSLVGEMSEAIAPLVSMLRDTSSVAGQKIAATALARLAVTDENKLQIAQSGGIDVLIVQVAAAVAPRNCCSTLDAPLLRVPSARFAPEPTATQRHAGSTRQRDCKRTRGCSIMPAWGRAVAANADCGLRRRECTHTASWAHQLSCSSYSRGGRAGQLGEA